MKIVITGGTGFVGRHLVNRAVVAGAEVVFTGRSVQAAHEIVASSMGRARFVALNHGTPDAAQKLSEICKSADALVHCAALSSPWGSREDFAAANVASTEECLLAAHRCSVPRFVHLSTPSLYFDFKDRLDIREESLLPKPVNDYVRTKLQAERLVQASRLPQSIILRPRAIFGPHDQTLLPRLLRVMKGSAFPLVRNGRIQLDLTYIDNLTDAVWLALHPPISRPCAIYNVTNGEPQTLIDLLSQMATTFSLPLRTRNVPWTALHTLAHAMELYARLRKKSEPLLTRYSAGVIAFSQTLNIDSIRADLGYAPSVSIADGLARHAAWHERQEEK